MHSVGKMLELSNNKECLGGMLWILTCFEELKSKRGSYYEESALIFPEVLSKIIFFMNNLVGTYHRQITD